MSLERERNQDATCYVGNLDERVTDALLWELFVQAGPLVNVHVPKDRVTGLNQSFAFVEFLSEEDADYAIRVMNMIRLFGKPIRVNKASSDRKATDGSEAFSANLFIGNLHPDVDEKTLYDTFSAFGMIVQTPKIGRDLETGNPKGFGFVSFETFEAADAAIEAMNGQFLLNKPITVQYAYKKDGKGERHGSAEERELAAKFKKASSANAPPNRFFAEPNKVPNLPPAPAGPPIRMLPGVPFPTMPPPGFSVGGATGAPASYAPAVPSFPTLPPPGLFGAPPPGFPTMPPPPLAFPGAQPQ